MLSNNRLQLTGRGLCHAAALAAASRRVAPTAVASHRAAVGVWSPHGVRQLSRKPLGGMKMNRRTLIMPLLVGSLVWPCVAGANLIWPALVVTERLVAFPPIVVGLVVEILTLHVWLEMPWSRAVVAAAAMNAASVAFGLVLVPLSGLLWEVFPGLALYNLFNIGTFNPGTWTATFFLASAANAVVEAGVLRWVFGFPFTRRLVAILVVANAASVGIAYVSLWLHPAEY